MLPAPRNHTQTTLGAATGRDRSAPTMLPEQAWSRRRAPHLPARQCRGAPKERRQQTLKRAHRENTSPHHERSQTLYAGTKQNQPPCLPPSYECAGHSVNARRHQQPIAPPPPSTKYERTRRFVNARGLPSGRARLLTCISPPKQQEATTRCAHPHSAPRPMMDPRARKIQQLVKVPPIIQASSPKPQILPYDLKGAEIGGH